MEYNLKQQLPYVTIMILLSWLYIYFYPTKYALLIAILVVPLITVSLWGYYNYAERSDSFSISGALKKPLILPLLIAYIIVSCINRYHEVGSCSVLYILSMAVTAVLAVVIIERSIYD